MNQAKKHKQPNSIASMFEAQRKKARTNEEQNSPVPEVENEDESEDDDGNRSGDENEVESGINILIDKLTSLNSDGNECELISIGINIVLSSFSIVDASLSDADDSDNQLDSSFEPNPTSSRTY